jgi:replicative DNA helicase
MVYSHEVERQFLAGLLKLPEKYSEVCSFITSSDFYSEVNQVLYSFIKSSYDGGESLDHVVLSEKIKLSGISFEDNINISDYIHALMLRQISKGSFSECAKELKKLTARRDIMSFCGKISKKMKSIDSSKSLNQIIEESDKIYSNINVYENSDHTPQNIFEQMESVVELRGNNPVKEFGPSGPHKRIQDLYGSLLRPGNITTIVARTGVGKTQFVMDFCIKVSHDHGIPVLHLDNGEMSKEELLARQCASLAQVPLNLIETGQWRNAGEDIVKKVRSVWPLIKERKFYYQNVGGMKVDSMVQLVKHFYYSQVKRGNPMILSFDYIKTTSEMQGNKMEWQVVGEMIDKFKKLVQRDIVYNSEPRIAMMTSVQSNRSGITNNRNANDIVDDESVVSLSDRITQFSSHVFHLRKKTLDEITSENNILGTHKLSCFKYRHLGNDVMRAINPVRMPDGDLKKNYINLDFNNFNITEVGDLKDHVDSLVDVSLTEDELSIDLGI